jgi:mannosyltransferase OCH1-like enzyme
MLPINFYKSISIPWGKSANVFNFENPRWKVLEFLYNKNLNNINQKEFFIPKIIHQIWIGTDVPSDVIYLSTKLRNINSEWEYKLWTDKSFDFINTDLMNKINLIKNFGAKSDILRYLILEKYGGLYLDCDFIGVKNFSNLINNSTFIAGVCNPDDFNLPLINNGFIASTAKHPILEMIIQNILNNLDTLSEIKTQEEVFKYTGPDLFTEMVFKYLSSNINQDVLIYPSTYFYPISCRNKFRINEKFISKSSYAETYAIHLWNASWFDTDKSLYAKFKLLIPYRYFLLLSNFLKKIKTIIKYFYV